MKLTKEQAIAEHRKMWRWLAERPNNNKYDYLEMMGIDDNDLHNRCFLCTYAKAEAERQQLSEFKTCDYCPLDWGGKGCSEEGGSLYETWVFWGDIDDCSRRAEIAMQIAELPEMEEKNEL